MAQRNVGTVIRFEFTRMINKRRFWVATLFVPVILIVVFALVFVSNSATDKSAEEQKNAQFSFEYTDASGLIDEAVIAQLHGQQAQSKDSGIAAVRSGQVEAFFAYPEDPTSQDIEVYGADQGLFENGKYSSVAEAILQSSVEKKLDAPQATAIIQGDVSTDVTTYREGEPTGGFGSVIGSLLFLAIFYVVILLLGNQMLNSTLEEKENRVTEMILTTINPTSLLLGKVISLFMVGIVQMLVFAVPFAFGYLFFREQLNIPELDLSSIAFDPQRMIVGALILLGGFALFTGTLVALGAAMPTAKDAGPIFGALMVLVFIPFYTIALIISDPGAPIVQLFSFFPYSAPVTGLLRNAFGTLPLWQAVIMIVELFIAAAIALRIAVQLFRYGSIEYSRKVSLRNVFGGRRSGGAIAGR